MSVPKPGEYITAKCGRCNDITGHVVMLVLDGQISKVECKACGSVHKYRETRPARPKRTQAAVVRHVKAGQSRDEAKDVKPSRTAARAATESAASKASPGAAARKKAENAWQEAMARHAGSAPLPYAMGSSYAPQDYLEHPAFGPGEVISVTPPDKMDVLFQEGVKTLRCKTD